MDWNKYYQIIKNHYEKLWGNISETLCWDKGPVNELPQEFQVLVFKPNSKRKMWTYATCGMSKITDEYPFELHIFAPERNNSLVELLTVVAHYHRTGSSLGLGHTINFGRPWLPESKCEYGLISLPYLDGPSLEWLDMDDKKTRFLWLIPITKREVEYKKKYGLDALEEKFDNEMFNYLEPLRMSVV
jgi:hypothetical protein